MHQNAVFGKTFHFKIWLTWVKRVTFCFGFETRIAFPTRVLYNFLFGSPERQVGSSLPRRRKVGHSARDRGQDAGGRWSGRGTAAAGKRTGCGGVSICGFRLRAGGAPPSHGPLDGAAVSAGVSDHRRRRSRGPWVQRQYRRDRVPFRMVALTFVAAFGTLAISFWPTRSRSRSRSTRRRRRIRVSPSCSGVKACSSSH